MSFDKNELCIQEDAGSVKYKYKNIKQLPTYIKINRPFIFLNDIAERKRCKNKRMFLKY